MDIINKMKMILIKDLLEELKQNISTVFFLNFFKNWDVNKCGCNIIVVSVRHPLSTKITTLKLGTDKKNDELSRLIIYRSVLKFCLNSLSIISVNKEYTIFNNFI